MTQNPENTAKLQWSHSAGVAASYTLLFTMSQRWALLLAKIQAVTLPSGQKPKHRKDRKPNCAEPKQTVW